MSITDVNRNSRRRSLRGTQSEAPFSDVSDGVGREQDPVMEAGGVSRTASRSGPLDNDGIEVRFIDTADTARILGLSPTTLRKAVSEGEREGHFYLPFHRFGRAIRYNLGEVLAYANRNRVSSREN